MPHTLLLADDSVTIQRVIELTFADEDITVIAVSDGDQAIEQLDTAPPDIVLADIGMPGKNGYEVAQYIRQTPKLSHIPVVLLTGAFEPVDQARATEAGCDGVLAKPFEPQMVIGRVKDLLAKGRQGNGSLEAAVAPPPPRPVEQGVPLGQAPKMPQPSPVAAPSGQPPPLDDYFDRLDAAFSSLGSPPLSPPTPEPMMAPPPAAPPPLVPSEIDWFSSAPTPGAPPEPWDLPESVSAAAAPDLPLAFASPDPKAPPFSPTAHVAAASAAAEAPAPSQAEAKTIVMPSPVAASAPSPAAPRTPLPSVASTELPSLGDAFAALLAAEQHDRSPSDPPSWPATMPAAAPAVTDAQIDDVVRRVLERMSDQVVRDTAADLVSQIAERLVREEIERIKASVK